MRGVVGGLADVENAFPARMRCLRGYQTQQEFADFVGISRPTVGFYENGQRFPDARSLRRIAEQCNVSTDWLVGLSDVAVTDDYVCTVCDHTGLSEACVKTLSELKRHINGDTTPGLRDTAESVLLLLSRVLTSLCD